MPKKIEVDDTETYKTILDICEDIENAIEILEDQSPSELEKETLSKICKDIKYEIENLESQSPSNLKKETLSEITINIKNKIEKLEGQSPSNLKEDTLSEICKDIKYEIEKLENLCIDDLEKSKKNGKKKRKPSGYAKPTLISKELCFFLGEPNETQMARAKVTAKINEYVRENDLQCKINGRRIIPDTKLAKLLKVKSTNELTYFNLQRYLGPHFSN